MTTATPELIAPAPTQARSASLSDDGRTVARSVQTLRPWLRQELAKSTDLGLLEIDFGQSIAALGLSSLHAVRITGELEKLLGLEIDPTFLYEFDSVEALCVQLLKMHAARQSRQAQNVDTRWPLRIAASFTAEPIADALQHLGQVLGQPVDVQFSRYNQLFQELLNPHSDLGQARSGVVALLLRIEDWFRYQPQAPGLPAVEALLDEFIRALEGAAARSQVPLLLTLAPHSPAAVRHLGLSDHLARLDQRLIDAAGRLPQVQVLDLRRIEDDYQLQHIQDATRDELGHIPYTQAGFNALGAALMRRCTALRLGAAKVIVLDCDNTLWGGVCGEDGPAGVRTDGPWAELQRFMLACQARGQLLCLCSKNNEADVMATFAQQPGMPLQLAQVAAWRINWQRKSQNLRELAAELNLGLDSFIFVDDNPVECAEVQQALPEVLCVQVPAEPHRMAGYFAHHWAFDTLAVTDEDRRRTEMMKQNQARRRVQEQSSGGLAAFIAQLGLTLDLAAPDEDEWARCAQLTQRTNQFNADKKVLGEAALRAHPGLLRVRVKDRFGDYGLVGLAGGRRAGDDHVVDTFMLSCRVLGRGVEHAMVRALAAQALAGGARRLVLRFVPSERNTVARAFLASLGAGLVRLPEDLGGEGVVFDARDVEAVLAQAVHLQEPPRETGGSEVSATAAAMPPALSSARADAAAGLHEIALTGPRMDEMQLRIASSSGSRRPQLSTEYATPRTLWEKKIAATWRDVLRIDRVGVHDDFYELGGDSLRAAEAFARMWDQGVPESVSLQTVEQPTVASLCQAIEAVLAGDRPKLLADHFSLADEGRLAQDVGHPGYDVRTYDAPMRQVLMTGASGYVGAYVVHELMQQTEAEVICLVRAATPEDGRHRVLANLRRYGLVTPALEQRLSVVLGDLTEPGLGLAPEAFRALAERIDTIFHSAAWVNFVYPYQHLKASNVDATETLLRLATAAAPKPIQVHFISTMGVVMSTGYGRTTPVREDQPLLHADDLLNGYEQSKYAADKLVWQAFQERGIPGNIYRPGLVSGLSDGTYHKLDEFLPQCFKGCLQLGSFPAVDTLWQMAPVDFVSKAIVHIARQPRHLNKAYFVTHPESQHFSDFIRFYQDVGYRLRAVPWDVWKREFLSLGVDRLRDNAMFPFVDFIRALSEEQVFFPPLDMRQFEEATRDLVCEVPPQMTLMARYTRHWRRAGYYDSVPVMPGAAVDEALALRCEDVPKTAAVQEQDQELKQDQDQAQTLSLTAGPLDEHLRFDPTRMDESEAYYLLWADAARGLSMVLRYVLHNGPIDEAKVAEVWCWFRDAKHPERDLAVRQRYPLGRAEIINTEAVRLRVGPSGYGAHRVWGEVQHGGQRLQWDFALHREHGDRHALALQRVQGMEAHAFYPQFQSNGVRQWISGTVNLGGHRYELDHQVASDGHYWNTRQLKAWSWGHCAQFDGDEDFVFEGIAARLNDWTQPASWLTFRYQGQTYESTVIEAFYFNRELGADLQTWQFVAERGDLRFKGTLRARTDEQILIVHPLPDEKYLYTHITYTGDMDVDIERREGGQWWKLDSRRARGCVAFEVTRPERNPSVQREFKIVRER